MGETLNDSALYAAEELRLIYAAERFLEAAASADKQILPPTIGVAHKATWQTLGTFITGQEDKAYTKGAGHPISLLALEGLADLRELQRQYGSEAAWQTKWAAIEATEPGPLNARVAAHVARASGPLGAEVAHISRKLGPAARYINPLAGIHFFGDMQPWRDSLTPEGKSAETDLMVTEVFSMHYELSNHNGLETNVEGVFHTFPFGQKPELAGMLANWKERYAQLAGGSLPKQKLTSLGYKTEVHRISGHSERQGLTAAALLLEEFMSYLNPPSELASPIPGAEALQLATPQNA